MYGNEKGYFLMLALNEMHRQGKGVPLLDNSFAFIFGINLDWKLLHLCIRDFL